MIKLALAVDADARAVRKRLRGRGRGRPDRAVRLDRQGHLRGPGRLGLPRRDLHPPPGVRHRQGLRGRRQGHRPLHDDRRRVRARPGTRQHAPLRAAGELDQGPRRAAAPARHAAELRLDGRHHRRQLGQPRRQPRQRGRRPDLRRQHPVARARLRLRRPPRPRRLGRLPRHHRGAAVDLPCRGPGRGIDRQALTPGGPGQGHSLIRERQGSR